MRDDERAAARDCRLALRLAGFLRLNLRYIGHAGAISEPLRLNELIPQAVEDLVRRLDSAIADPRLLSDGQRGARFPDEVADEVDAGGGDGQRRSATDAHILLAINGDGARDAGDSLLVLETELRDETTAEISRAGRGVLIGRDGVETHSSLLLILIPDPLQEGGQLAEYPPDLLLADIGQVEDFLEGTRYVVLATGDEDASSDNDFLRLALEDLVLVDELEDVLGSVGHVLAHVDGVAEGYNLLVSLLQVLVPLVGAGVVLRAREGLVGLGLGEGHRRGELLAFGKLILGTTNTAGVVTILVIVGESSPFGSRVDDAPTDNDTATLAHNVSVGVLLDQVGRNLLAVGAAEDIAEILFEHPPVGVGAIGREHFGLVRSGRVDVVDFVKNLSRSLGVLVLAPELLTFLGNRLASR